jgi:hypothetical protein
MCPPDIRSDSGIDEVSIALYKEEVRIEAIGP